MKNPIAPRVQGIAHMLSRIQPKDGDVHGAKLKSVAHSMSRAVSALSNMLESQSETETQATHYKRVGTAAKQLKEKSVIAFNNAQRIWAEGRAEILSRIDAKVNLKPDEKIAAEIRSLFRAKNSSEQLDMLTELAKANDGPSLAALINAPTVLTGIKKELAQVMRDKIASENAPEEQAELQALNDLLELTVSVIDTTGHGAKELFDPARLASIERSEAAAAAAQIEFDRSTASS